MATNSNLRTIEVDQYFPHPPTKLWHAITTPGLMAQWLLPNDFQPIVGHTFTFTGKPISQTGFSGQIRCKVIDLVPEKRLSITWSDADKTNGGTTEVTWTLQPEGKGTRLFLEHAGFDPNDPTDQLARKIMNGGWRSHVLRRMSDLLEYIG